MYTAKLLILQALSVSAVAQTGKDTENLLTELLETRGYDKRVRPIINKNQALSVAVTFTLKSVLEFDEQKETLKTSGFLHVYWIDEYLQWDLSDYNNITHVYIPQDEIWKPDLTLRNTYSTVEGLDSDKMKMLVFYNGLVRWDPFLVLQSACSVDIKYFPFDTQTCDLQFIVLSYLKFDLKFINYLEKVNLVEYLPDGAWDLVSTNSYREEDYHKPSFIFSLNLKRKSTFFLINIITPVILLSVLNSFTFLLPVESGERAQFSVTVFLSLAVFLTIVSDRLPSNSDTISLMAIYLTMMTSLSTFIVIACLAQIRLSARKEEEQPVTGCYAAMVKLANCCGCNKMGNIQNRLTWWNVVHITDFIFFWLSFIYTVLITSLFAYSAFVG